VLLAIVQARLSRAQDDLRGALSVLEGVRGEVAATPDWVTDQLCLEQAVMRLALGGAERAVGGLDALARPPDLRGALVRAQARMDQDPGLSLDGQLSSLLVPAQPLQALVAGWLLEAANLLRGGEVDRARVALERSLRLAAPERLRRPFREAPAEVADLLADELRRAGHARWLDSTRPSAPRHVGEPLTARELEVLGYVADLLSTEEIAATMYVSVNTVRTHVRSILRKLGVSRRNEAVRRARELSLIGSG
jgi:LuxR family maltose regulon positive regulatory protein